MPGDLSSVVCRSVRQASQVREHSAFARRVGTRRICTTRAHCYSWHRMGISKPLVFLSPCCLSAYKCTPSPDRLQRADGEGILKKKAGRANRNAPHNAGRARRLNPHSNPRTRKCSQAVLTICVVWTSDDSRVNRLRRGGCSSLRSVCSRSARTENSSRARSHRTRSQWYVAEASE